MWINGIFVKRNSLRKLKRFIKAVGKFIFGTIFFILFVLCELIVCSKASFHDFFTTEQVSTLKDRPSSIKKDIIVDACGINGSCSGIKALTENIINGICKKRPDWRFVILGNSDIERPFEFSHKNVKVIYINYCCLTKPLMLIRDILSFATFGIFRDQITQLLCYDNIYFNENSCDLFFDPYAELIVNDYSSVPKISLIHDLLYRDIPEYFGAKKSELEDLKSNSRKIVEYSKKLLTVSEFSKERIIENFGVDSNFVQAIHIKLANRIKKERSQEFMQTTLEKFKLREKEYLIYPSMARPRKNHKRLFQAFIKFYKEHNKSDIKLVIVGSVADDMIKQLQEMIYNNAENKFQAEDLKEKIIFTQFVPNDELDVLLKKSLAMIFPSFYEGFGMPIIEAMSVGIPVACGNKTSLPEVAGNAALLFDPYNVDEIADAINTMVTDSDLRAKLIKLGYERAKYFSDQDSMIDEYINVFEKYMVKTENNMDS